MKYLNKNIYFFVIAFLTITNYNAQNLASLIEKVPSALGLAGWELQKLAKSCKKVAETCLKVAKSCKNSQTCLQKVTKTKIYKKIR